jgi:hypothetical protein
MILKKLKKKMWKIKLNKHKANYIREEFLKLKVMQSPKWFLTKYAEMFYVKEETILNVILNETWKNVSYERTLKGSNKKWL